MTVALLLTVGLIFTALRHLGAAAVTALNNVKYSVQTFSCCQSGQNLWFLPKIYLKGVSMLTLGSFCCVSLIGIIWDLSTQYWKYKQQIPQLKY